MSEANPKLVQELNVLFDATTGKAVAGFTSDYLPMVPGFIAAVNSHAALVEALANMVEIVELVDPGVYSDSIADAKAAIAAAEPAGEGG